MKTSEIIDTLKECLKVIEQLEHHSVEWTKADTKKEKRKHYDQVKRWENRYIQLENKLKQYGIAAPEIFDPWAEVYVNSMEKLRELVMQELMGVGYV